MSNSHIRISLLVLIALGALAWVSSISAQASSGLGGTSWQLVRIRGRHSITLTSSDRSKYTIAFGTDGWVSAGIDCNRGRGAWKSSSRSRLRFGPMVLTRAMCPPGSLHDRIVKDWSRVRAYFVKSGHLFLSLSSERGVYEFEPVSSSRSSLFGKRWNLVEINGAAVRTTRAYIEFDRDTKRFSGDGGCNRFAGNFATTGSSIRFSQTLSTKRACIDLEIQQVETNFLSALERVTEFEIQGEVLRLRAAGRPRLTFRSD